MSGWSLFWLALLVLGAAGEAVALARSGAGDTFSESVWFVYRSTPAVRFFGSWFLLWLTVHFATVGRWASWTTFGGCALVALGAWLLVVGLRGPA